jgi:hypothetical protein
MGMPLSSGILSAAAGIDGGAQEVGDGDAGDGDGVLEGKKNSLTGTFIGFKLKDVPALEQYSPCVTV